MDVLHVLNLRSLLATEAEKSRLELRCSTDVAGPLWSWGAVGWMHYLSKCVE